MNTEQAPTDPGTSKSNQHGFLGSPEMMVLIVVGLAWLSLRSLMLLTQINRHSPEAQLSREFDQELRDRGLIQSPPGFVDRR